MIDGELTAISRAWEFQVAAEITERPVSIEKYVRAVGAELRVRDNLRDDEAGQNIQIGERRIIVVNGRHAIERQRFTVLHEIAHIKLELPSTHVHASTVDQMFGYSKRPREEILCDIFASECLLPRRFFQADVRDRPCSFATVQELAELYQASLAATGSRFATYSESPCCWVLADDRYVRYAACSPSLRNLGFFLKVGVEIPRESVLGRLRAGSSGVRPGIPQVVPGHTWVHNDCDAIDEFSEAAVVSGTLRQGVSLLCAEISAGRGGNTPTDADTEDELLPELDGQLHFPGRRGRK
jgi:Zn-dependent peptidase ImmA (M78 family)